MRCNTAQQLLYLHREGERSARQERRLAHHLLTCASCRELAEQQAAEYDALLHTLRETRLNATEEEVLVHGVMARITRQRQTVARERPRYDAAATLVLRYAAAILVVLITGGFLFQFITVHNRADALGRMLTDSALPAVRVDIGYEIRTTPADLAALDSLCLPASQAMMFAQGSRISRDEAESLFRIAALDPRCRRQLDAGLLHRAFADVDITPMLTLRIQHQGA